MKDSTCILFCDESGRSGKEKFLVIGVLSCPRDDFFKFEERITKYRYKKIKWGEIKWSKSSDGKEYQDFYLGIIKGVLENTGISYKAIVIKKSQLDYKQYHKNNINLAFLKFYFLILRERMRNLNFSNFYILIDRLSVSEDMIREFKKFVRKYGKSEGIHCICQCNSHINNLIQISDFITGAIANCWNNNNSTKNSKILDYLEDKFHLKIRKREYYKSNQKTRFQIWRWKPVAEISALYRF